MSLKGNFNCKKVMCAKICLIIVLYCESFAFWFFSASLRRRSAFAQSPLRNVSGADVKPKGEIFTVSNNSFISTFIFFKNPKG